MIGLLTGGYAKAIGVFVAGLMMVAGLTWVYNKGYNSAVIKWEAKYNLRENELIRASMAETARQQAANAEAKKLEAERIAQLEADNEKLSQLIKELSDEADKDPAADNVCLSPDSRVRINKVR